MRLGAEPVIEGLMKFVREQRRRKESRRKESEREEDQRGEDAREAEGRRWEKHDRGMDGISAADYDG